MHSKFKIFMLLTVLLHVDSFSWSEWVLYPDFLVGWLVLGGVYLLAAGPLRERFDGSAPVPLWQVASFSGGMLLMLLALQGPLHELSDYFLFSAHMVQHMILTMAVPLFCALGAPVTLALRTLPPVLYGQQHPYGVPFTGSGTAASAQGPATCRNPPSSAGRRRAAAS